MRCDRSRSTGIARHTPNSADACIWSNQPTKSPGLPGLPAWRSRVIAAAVARLGCLRVPLPSTIFLAAGHRETVLTNLSTRGDQGPAQQIGGSRPPWRKRKAWAASQPIRPSGSQFTPNDFATRTNLEHKHPRREFPCHSTKIIIVRQVAAGSRSALPYWAVGLGPDLRRASLSRQWRGARWRTHSPPLEFLPRALTSMCLNSCSLSAELERGRPPFSRCTLHAARCNGRLSLGPEGVAGVVFCFEAFLSRFCHTHSLSHTLVHFHFSAQRCFSTVFRVCLPALSGAKARGCLFHRSTFFSLFFLHSSAAGSFVLSQFLMIQRRRLWDGWEATHKSSEAHTGRRDMRDYLRKPRDTHTPPNWFRGRAGGGIIEERYHFCCTYTP